MTKEQKMNDTASLRALKHRIEKAKKGTKRPSPQKSAPSTTIKQFLNVGAEFVSGILAGVAGGLFIDWAFSSSPWGLISFFILGSAAGFLNVYRALMKPSKKI